MSLELMNYQPVGDKKNSDLFNEYRIKIYERRKSSGLEDLLKGVCALVVQVETGDAISYLQELYIMTPYRFREAYQNDTVWGGRGSITSGIDVATWLEPGELLKGTSHQHYAVNWDLADPDSFRAHHQSMHG